MSNNGKVEDTKPGFCLCGCGGKAQSHGLSPSHYKYALGLVRDGLTTWNKLEKAGKALPTKSTRIQAWFAEVIEKDKET